MSDLRPVIYLVLSLALCAFCSLDALDSYPMYFFCDEAIHVFEAKSLLNRGVDLAGQPWPIFFRAFGAYELTASVYAQLPFNYLFGPTVFAARCRGAVCALLLTGVAAYVAKRQLRMTTWWAAPLAIYSSSFFYLHARTGFQLTLAALGYCSFVLLYLGWRMEPERSRRLGAAALCAALAAYTYTAARGWVAWSALFFFVLDFRLLWAHRRIVAIALIPAAVAMIPFFYFVCVHPDRAFTRFYGLGGAKIAAAPFDSLVHGLKGLSALLDPRYWFGTAWQRSFAGAERHRVAGLPYISPVMFPFFVMGCFAFARRRASWSGFHTLAVGGSALLPAVLLEVNPLRCLPVWFAVVLTMMAGIEQFVRCRPWLESLRRIRQAPYAKGTLEAVLFIGMATVPLYQHWWALNRSAAVVEDYGFRGIQFGARRLADWLKDHWVRPDRVRFDLMTFNEPSMTVAMFSNVQPNAYRFFFVQELCREPLTEERVPPEILWVTRRDPRTIFPEKCRIAPKVVRTILDPVGKPALYIMSFIITPPEVDQEEAALSIKPGEEIVLPRYRADSRSGDIFHGIQ